VLHYLRLSLRIDIAPIRKEILRPPVLITNIEILNPKQILIPKY
jgi:hypothetical protein